MLLANFNGKEHLRHRAVSLRQHGFLVIIITGRGLTDGTARLSLRRSSSIIVANKQIYLF